jgi:hypothetical protein
MLNPYRWNQKASIIFLEAPAGVGYSYSETNDKKTADDNLVFLKQWFPGLSGVLQECFLRRRRILPVFTPQTLVYLIMKYNEQLESSASHTPLQTATSLRSKDSGLLVVSCIQFKMHPPLEPE